LKLLIIIIVIILRNGKENQKAGLIAGQKQKTIKVTEAESVVLIGS